MRRYLFLLSGFVLWPILACAQINPNPADAITQNTFAHLGTPPNGIINFCTDCQQVDPCAGGGTGAYAYRNAGAWSCGAASSGGLTDPGSDGFVTRTSASTVEARSFSSPLGTLAIGNSDGVAGNPTLDVDSSIMGQFATGATSFGGTCTPGDWYYETDTFFATFCPVTDTGYTVVALAHAAGVPTDDNTLVGSGTAWAKKALPDCDDAGGSHLNYDTATNAFSCGTSGDGTGAAFDPSTTVTLTEEFITGTVVTGGTIGSNGMVGTAIGTGTGGIQNAGALAHPGLFRLLSHAANDNSGYSISFANVAGNTSWNVWDSVGWSLDFLVLPGSNSTAITNTAIYVGLINADADPAAASAGIWARSDSDRSDASFIFAICNSATAGCGSTADDTAQKTVASTIAAVAGTWNRIRIRRVTAGVGGNPTIYFRVNDETEKTFCSSGCDDTIATLGTGTFKPAVVYLTRTTTGVLSADVDYMQATMSGLTRY